MTNLIGFFTKYKTYFVATIVLLTVAAQLGGVYWHYTVPEIVYAFEGALGIAVFRVDLTGVGAGTGWKSYAAAAVIFGAATANVFGVVIPPEIWALLSAAGLGSVGSAVYKAQTSSVANLLLNPQVKAIDATQPDMPVHSSLMQVNDKVAIVKSVTTTPPVNTPVNK